ncbi:MAG TPA: ATP-binding protein [Acidobacteriaceae bacterium]|nr:ATP-binding protein [Acidobacteriaceae bacterium]
MESSTIHRGERTRGTSSPRARPAIGFRIPRLRFEVRLAALLFALALPTLAFASVALYFWHASVLVWICVLVVLSLALAWLGSAIFQHIVRPLQTLSNVVAALRENEYSFRAREIGQGDALGDLAAQINELAGDLRVRRHRESETFALLERVVESMELPVFAFNAAAELQLTNPAARKMLQLPANSMLHRSASSLGLTEILDCADNSVVTLTMHGREGRWMVRRSKFYQEGMPHTLLLLSDVSGVLREQERQAWRRLIRVLAHEVNNSLTPIKSIAGSLRSRMMHNFAVPPPDRMNPAAGATQDMNPVDMEHGLAIIEERAESLNRFLQAYSQLAKLPPPANSVFAATPLLERICHLETRAQVALEVAENVEIYADAAQLEQALINLVRNAVDAAMQAHEDKSAVRVAVICTTESDSTVILVEDNGTGLANPANLFVPLYTTKPGGMGVGLILALQIIEAHGGTLTVANRKDGPGCRAEIRLPIFSDKTALSDSSL